MDAAVLALVELKLRGDYRDVLGSMSRGARASVDASASRALATIKGVGAAAGPMKGLLKCTSPAQASALLQVSFAPSWLLSRA